MFVFIIFGLIFRLVLASGNSWTSLSNDKATPPVAPARHSATAVFSAAAGTTFIYGGRNEVLFLRDMYSYNAATRTWTARANGRYRASHSATAINNGQQILVFVSRKSVRARRRL
jgi:hypothetical protein